MKLEEKCSRCDGSGVIEDFTTTKRKAPVIACPTCRGKGRELTPAGASLLSFVLRWTDTDVNQAEGHVYSVNLRPRWGRIEEPNE